MASCEMMCAGRRISRCNRANSLRLRSSGLPARAAVRATGSSVRSPALITLALCPRPRRHSACSRAINSSNRTGLTRKSSAPLFSPSTLSRQLPRAVRISTGATSPAARQCRNRSSPSPSGSPRSRITAAVCARSGQSRASPADRTQSTAMPAPVRRSDNLRPSSASSSTSNRRMMGAFLSAGLPTPPGART